MLILPMFFGAFQPPKPAPVDPPSRREQELLATSHVRRLPLHSWQPTRRDHQSAQLLPLVPNRISLRPTAYSFACRLVRQQAVDINFALCSHIDMAVCDDWNIEPKGQPGAVARRILLTDVEQPGGIEGVEGV